MKQSIEFHLQRADTMIIGARKKQNHATFLHVHKGAVLIRLGKREFPVCADQSYWLPIGCLSALTVLQGSEISILTFSVRSINCLPNYAGFMTTLPFIHGVLTELQTYSNKGNTLWESAFGRLLSCMRDYISIHAPMNSISDDKCQLESSINKLNNKYSLSEYESKQLSDTTGFTSNELSNQLQIREWIRAIKSGQSLTNVASGASLTDDELTVKLQQIAGY